MATSARDFARRLDTAGRTLTATKTTALRSSSKVFQHGIERSFAQAGLRVGANLAGAPWKGVIVRPLDAERVEIRAANPAHLFNNRTSPHVIAAAGLGGSRSSRAARLGATASRTVRADGRRYTIRAESAGATGGRGTFTGLRRSARSGGKRALVFGGGHPFTWARHPGTRGRPAFSRGRDEAKPQAAETFLRAHRDELLRTVFTGGR